MLFITPEAIGARQYRALSSRFVFVERRAAFSLWIALCNCTVASPCRILLPCLFVGLFEAAVAKSRCSGLSLRCEASVSTHSTVRMRRVQPDKLWALLTNTSPLGCSEYSWCELGPSFAQLSQKITAPLRPCAEWPCQTLPSSVWITCCAQSLVARRIFGFLRLNGTSCF